jgi:hypothetical protein
MKLKLYTTNEGKPGELIDEVDMGEMELVSFCFANWPDPERALNTYNFDLPDWQRRPPFEIERPDGSLFPWEVKTRKEYEGDDDEDDEVTVPVVLDTTVSCQRCKSHRVASASSHGSDMQSFSIGSASHDGYLPDDVGIGGDDDLEIEYCLDCGQLQGEWPLPLSAIERGEKED